MVNIRWAEAVNEWNSIVIWSLVKCGRIYQRFVLWWTVGASYTCARPKWRPVERKSVMLIKCSTYSIECAYLMEPFDERAMIDAAPGRIPTTPPRLPYPPTCATYNVYSLLHNLASSAIIYCQMKMLNLTLVKYRTKLAMFTWLTTFMHSTGMEMKINKKKEANKITTEPTDREPPWIRHCNAMHCMSCMKDDVEFCALRAPSGEHTRSNRTPTSDMQSAFENVFSFTFLRCCCCCANDALDMTPSATIAIAVAASTAF